jgi:hypothetical protein
MLAREFLKDRGILRKVGRKDLNRASRQSAWETATGC